MSSHRGLPQGDWKKYRRRQLSGIMHSPLLFLLQFLSFSHHVVLFPKKGIDDYFSVDQMARSKLRLFQSIRESCKSNFLHIPHLSHYAVSIFLRNLVASFLVFLHFGKLGQIRTNPHFYRRYMVLSSF